MASASNARQRKDGRNKRIQPRKVLHHGRSPQLEWSPWLLVCIAQDLLWFFGLPILCKPWWESFWTSLDPVKASILLSLTGVPMFLIYSLVMLPIYLGNYPFFERYKTAEKEWPWFSRDPAVRAAFKKQSFKSVGLFFFNFFVLIPVLSYIKSQTRPLPSFADADWPSWTTMLWQNVAMTLLHELCFYSTHRLMHHPRFYRYHKVHHQYKNNNVLASQHNHPVDYIISIGGPAVLAPALVQPHSIVVFQWAVYVIWTNLDDHVGYSFPWSPVRWFHFANLTEQHEFHHEINMGCFASKLNIYDKIFKSEDTYLKWAQKRISAFQSPSASRK